MAITFRDSMMMSSPASSAYSGLPGDFDLPASSPLDHSTRRSTREKRPPTITPKRFTRFFAPRQHTHNTREAARAEQSARRLKDITRTANNTSRWDECKPMSERGHLSPQRKRRRLSLHMDSSPMASSPSKRGTRSRPSISILEDSDCETEVLGEDRASETFVPRPIIRVTNPSPVVRMLERSFGGKGATNRGRMMDHCLADWRHDTASFFTTPQDSHRVEGVPFCSTACQTNSLVAFGDDAGSVHLIDSSSDESIDFSKEHVSFRPHSNAVIDLAFSSDDLLLATASGDQTSRVCDMRTQQTRFLLPGHTSSVKQVRFQPGNDNILATSGRDGSVQIWDLRDRSPAGPALNCANPPLNPSQLNQVVYAKTCIAIRDAHAVGGDPAGMFKSTTRGSGVARTSEVSITAISFLPQGREHFLITASEANSSIKLWDIRAKSYSRRGPAVPLAVTAEPASHHRVRPYGLSSLALSADGSRIYSLCRDHSIYAYSTSDFILGKGGRHGKLSAGELSGTHALHRYKHDQLRVNSFYVKLALRPARGDRSEMLAAGSSVDCAVVVPTDEAYLNKETRRDTARAASTLVRSRSQAFEPPHLETPTHVIGTALSRYDCGEVSALTWTAGGDLAAVSDDNCVRCWRTGPKARELRLAGEQEGKRWGCGWAEVADEFDDDET